MEEFHEIISSAKEMKDSFNPDTLFAPYENQQDSNSDEIFTFSNLKRISYMAFKSICVLLIPFFTIFIEFYYLISTRFTTFSIVLNFERITVPNYAFSLKNLIILVCHLIKYINLTLSMFFFLLFGVISSPDSTLDVYFHNGLVFLIFTVVIYVVYYVTYKIRPLGRDSSMHDKSEKLKRNLNLHSFKHLQFWGDFPKKFSQYQDSQKNVSVYDLEEILEKSFEVNVEIIVRNQNFSGQYILVVLVTAINMMNMIVTFYDFFLTNEVTFFRLMTLHLYCFLMNFVFSCCFIYLFFDYTYARNISSCKTLLEMIKYEKFQRSKCPLKRKSFPTINFLCVESLFLWNKLRKWNMKKSGEKKTIFIDLFVAMIILYTTLTKIILILNTFIAYELIFKLNSWMMLILLIQTIGLEIILLWKLFQGAIANDFFKKFREQLLILKEDCIFLRANLERILNCEQDEKLPKKSREFMYLFMLDFVGKTRNSSCKKKENKQKMDEISQKINDCEFMISHIINEVKFDEKFNVLKFGLIIPMNFTTLKSLMMAFGTLFLTLLNMLMKSTTNI